MPASFKCIISLLLWRLRTRLYTFSSTKQANGLSGIRNRCRSIFGMSRRWLNNNDNNVNNTYFDADDGEMILGFYITAHVVGLKFWNKLSYVRKSMKSFRYYVPWHPLCICLCNCFPFLTRFPASFSFFFSWRGRSWGGAWNGGFLVVFAYPYECLRIAALAAFTDILWYLAISLSQLIIYEERQVASMAWYWSWFYGKMASHGYESRSWTNEMCLKTNNEQG